MARRSAEHAAGSRARAELRALAAELFPSAVAADFDPARTAALAADASVPAVRDAAFESAGVAGRADFLVRETGGFGLRRVSAVLRPGETQLDELAFAHFAARRAGLAVSSVALLHLDPDFVRGAAPPGARELLRHTDVTRDVAPLSRDLAARVAGQLALLGSGPPAVEPSPHCRRPETCPFLPRCSEALAPDWIGQLPGLRPQHFAALRELGVARIADVPADFPLTPAQRNALASLTRGAPYAAAELAGALEACQAGADFLDFEAIVPAVPLYPGTRAYEPVPFQWSAHLHRADAEPAHAEFLAEDGGADPRRGFAESLVAAFAGRALPVAVYSSFESDVLAGLARAFPDLAAGLEAVRARLLDLLPVLRRSVYHPGFQGSFSLKRVAPVLAPGFGFGDLPGIADGGAAARGWHALARGELAPDAAARMFAELRAYCARDSLALARVLDALRELAAHSSP